MLVMANYYVFLNPLVVAMYSQELLTTLLHSAGFEILTCQINHIQKVLQEYDIQLNQGKACLDMRCPMAVELANTYSHPYECPAIEPILIHSAREVVEAYKNDTLPIYITTPCQSLADYGNQLALPNTTFLTWNDFVRKFHLSFPKKNDLSQSPVPPGFFQSLNHKILSLSSKDEIVSYFSNQQDSYELIEMLYCSGGCHNGDGV